MNQTIDRRYLAAMAIFAALVLTGGSLLRQNKPGVEQPSPSETASLQQAVRMEEVDRVAATLAERALSAARYVVYLPDRHESGVLWDVAGGVAAPGTPNRLLTLSGSASRVPPPRLAKSREEEARWLLVVGRSAESNPVWSATLGGGSRAALCDGVPYRERVVSVPLGRELLGAGVFDSDGALAGLVCECDSTYHVVSSDSIGELLKPQSAPSDLWALYGFRVAGLDAGDGALFAKATGLLLTDISKSGTGYEAGLRAGDLIVGVADEPVLAESDLLKRMQSESEPAAVTIVRAGLRKTLQVVLPARNAAVEPAGYGMKVLPPSRPPSQVLVFMNTPAYRAGIRTGDPIVQVGPDRNPSSGQLSRALGQGTDSPLLIVFEREGLEHAVWMSR